MFKEELTKIAFEMSKPFCYHCYTEAVHTSKLGTRCPKCFTDDLMRILPDDGPEWGTDWIVRSILETHCTKISWEQLEERFADMLNECCEKVKVGGYEWDHGDVFKRLDPVAFHQELLAYVDAETNETLVTYDNGTSYYDTHVIESFVNDHM